MSSLYSVILPFNIDYFVNHFRILGFLSLIALKIFSIHRFWMLNCDKFPNFAFMFTPITLSII